MRLLALLIAVLCAGLVSTSSAAEKEAEPKVVFTLPESYNDEVDPTLDRIVVTFDRPMADRSWSWTGGGETYPQITGQPSYDTEKKTCTLPVKLEPGKVYWIGVNSPSHTNFKSAEGVPAKRHVILFATKSADGKPTHIPESLLDQAESINDSNPAGKNPREKAAVDAANHWLGLVDRRDNDGMWNNLSPIAASMITKESFTSQVARVRDMLGELKQREFAKAEHKTSLPGVPDGNYYLLEFKTSFEKKKEAVETIIMHESDGTWKVCGYFMR